MKLRPVTQSPAPGYPNHREHALLSGVIRLTAAGAVLTTLLTGCRKEAGRLGGEIAPPPPKTTTTQTAPQSSDPKQLNVKTIPPDDLVPEPPGRLAGDVAPPPPKSTTTQPNLQPPEQKSKAVKPPSPTEPVSLPAGRLTGIVAQPAPPVKAMVKPTVTHPPANHSGAGDPPPPSVSPAAVAPDEIGKTSGKPAPPEPPGRLSGAPMPPPSHTVVNGVAE